MESGTFNSTSNTSLILGFIGVVLGASAFWEFMKYIISLIADTVRKKRGKKKKDPIEDLKVEFTKAIADIKADNERYRAEQKAEFEKFKTDQELANLRHDQADDRMLMLSLMEHAPDDLQSLLTVGKHYFVELGGNWVMEEKFKKHLTDRGHEIPSWFYDRVK